MAANVLVDAGFLVALLTDRDTHHHWAVAVSEHHPPPWKTCEGALAEAFYLLGRPGASALAELIRRRTANCPFRLDDHSEEVAILMQKYADIPMSFADACLVRMSETVAEPILLTTDTDFQIYRRHSRQVIPCITPR